MAAGCDEIHVEMHRRDAQPVFLVESPEADTEPLTEPILNRLDTQLDVPRIEHDARRIAMGEPDQFLATEDHERASSGKLMTDITSSPF